MTLCLTGIFYQNFTGRSQRQVPIVQWQGIGPARTGRGAAPATHTAFRFALTPRAPRNAMPL